MTISTENFLKTIYLLTHDDDQDPSPSAIARILNISNAAVTDMARKLDAKELVDYQKYKNLKLTPKGEELAVKTIRRHRLWEAFLQEVLDVPLDKVHDEAESLEHHVSDYLTEKIDKYLGYPDFDPHGDPIPDSSGDFPDVSHFILLKNMTSDKAYKVMRIEHHRVDVLLRLRSLNILPGARVDLIDVMEDDGSILLKVNGEKVILPEWLSEKVEVKALDLLSGLPLNKSALIQDVIADKYQKRRFLDLGFVRGTSVQKVMSAPSGDPCSYEIRGTVIALRNEEAAKILIEYE